MGRATEDRRGRRHNTALAGKADFHDINWHHYTHPQLYDMVWTADPGHIRDQSTEWGALATAIADTTSGVRQTLSRLFGTWQGAAADTAKASNDRLEHWAEEMTERTNLIAHGLAGYSETLSDARSAMPPPEFAWAEHAANHGDPFKMMSGPSGSIELSAMLDDHQPNFEKHHAAWQEAVRVMSAYGRQSQGVHDDLPPHYEPAPATGQGDPTTIPGWTDPTPITYPPPGVDPKPVGQPVPVGSDVPGDIDGDGVPDGTTPGGYTGTGIGSGAGYGAGLAAGPGGGTGSDVTRGIPGAGGQSGAAPLAARAGSAVFSGARGAGGAGAFPFGGGAGAQREEDREHKTKYVEGVDWLDELPPAYPPVFGA